MTSQRNQVWLWTATAAAMATSIGYYFLRNENKRKIRQRSIADFVQGISIAAITPQQALQLITQRRSIFPKQYSAEQVSKQVLKDMLEAARWAPSHHLTQPWHFIVFETLEQRNKLGLFLADHYQDTQELNHKEVSPRKFAKKIANCEKASYIVALCVKTNTRNAVLEEVCSVACAVQNMHLVATAHKVAAHWSSSAVFSNDGTTPPSVLEFLDLPVDEYLCLGWMFVGGVDAWPKQSQRKPCSSQVFGES
jgi:nitroreductase